MAHRARTARTPPPPAHVSPARRVASIAAGLVAVGVPLSGWVGARILTDAPRFRPPRPSLRAWFPTAVRPDDDGSARGEVQLSGDEADLPGTWGLLYDGGMSQVLDPTGWTGGPVDRRVLRPFLALDGTLPGEGVQADRRRGPRRASERRSAGPARGARRRRSLLARRHRRGPDRRGVDRRQAQASGPWPVRAALSSYAFPDDPQLLAARIGARWQLDAVPTSVGHLPAWRFTPAARDRPDRSGVWVIGVHGRGARRTELFRLVSTVVAGGATCLVTSYRTDRWTRQPAVLTTLGQEEWEDVDAAIRLAVEEGAEQVVLAGCSLGGAIVAQTMRRSTVADRVAGVILDAPALQWHPILMHVAERRHLPRPLIPLVMQVARVRAKLDWHALDHVAAAGDFRHPILLFHGTEDPTVPVWLSDAFAAARPDLVTYVRVAGAGHVRAWNTDRARFEREVTTFLARVSQRAAPAGEDVTRGAGPRPRAPRAARAARSSR